MTLAGFRCGQGVRLGTPCVDALHRTESCGGHFRTESQTPDGEALRDDAHFGYVAAWEYATPPVLPREGLLFSDVTASTRSYR